MTADTQDIIIAVGSGLILLRTLSYSFKMMVEDMTEEAKVDTQRIHELHIHMAEENKYPVTVRVGGSSKHIPVHPESIISTLAQIH